MTQTVKIPRLPIQETQEMWVWSLGWEDPPKKQMAIKILVSYSPWGRKESDMTEQLNTQSSAQPHEGSTIITPVLQMRQRDSESFWSHSSKEQMQ